MERLRSLLLIFLCFGAYFSYAQSDTSARKVVKIIYADSIKAVDEHPGQAFIGRVQLFHNDTYMNCDSAYVHANQFRAFGHISMVNQDGAVLYGDSLFYDGNINLAQVRGKIVRLVDTTAELRTSFLDFNTSENVGYFFDGGTVKNKNSLLESQRGYYYSKSKLFVFRDEVEMQDTTYTIKSDSAHYNSVTEIATFFGKTFIWHKDGFLSCFYGWLDQPNDAFHFSSDAYLQTDKQEIWANRMYYNRRIGKGDLYDKVQMLDTAKSMLAFADEAHIVNEPETVTLMQNPSIAYYSVDSTSKRDTLFLRGDTLKFITYKNPKYLPKDTLLKTDSSLIKPGMPSVQFSSALPLGSLTTPPEDTVMRPVLPESSDSFPLGDSLKTTLPDSLLSQRTDTAKRAELQEHNDNLPLKDSLKDTMPDSVSLRDSLQNMIPKSAEDSIKIMANEAIQWCKDSLLTKKMPVLLVKKDSLLPADTLLRDVYALHHVRAYRGDVQMVCDSLVYSTIDSIARLYNRPAMWHETYQMTSDSMLFYTKDQQITKAAFLSSAFLLFYEDFPDADTIHYNQVKGNDMYGYFRENDLYRFDVERGVQTVYFLAEDSVVVNVDIAESENFSATVKDRKIQRMKYISKITNDMHPLGEGLPKEKTILKGFESRQEERPKTRFDVCAETPKASRREEISQIPMPLFPITERINLLEKKK